MVGYIRHDAARDWRCLFSWSNSADGDDDTHWSEAGKDACHRRYSMQMQRLAGVLQHSLADCMEHKHCGVRMTWNSNSLLTKRSSIERSSSVVARCLHVEARYSMLWRSTLGPSY